MKVLPSFGKAIVERTYTAKMKVRIQGHVFYNTSDTVREIFIVFLSLYEEKLSSSLSNLLSKCLIFFMINHIICLFLIC